MLYIAAALFWLASWLACMFVVTILLLYRKISLASCAAGGDGDGDIVVHGP